MINIISCFFARNSGVAYISDYYSANIVVSLDTRRVVHNKCRHSFIHICPLNSIEFHLASVIIEFFVSKYIFLSPHVLLSFGTINI